MTLPQRDALIAAATVRMTIVIIREFVLLGNM
jgi:hypothetical protein